MGPRIWLAAIEVAGRRLLVATEAVAPVATSAAEGWAAGTALMHLPLLSVPSVAWEVLPGGATIGSWSAEVSFLLPSDLSLAALEASGQVVERIPVELSIWRDGDAYEAREVLISGWLELEGYPEAGEAVSGSIVAASVAETATVPLAEDVVSDENLNPYTLVSGGSTVGFSMPDDVVGQQYPIPLGRPGLWVDEDGTEQDIPSTPAILITQAATHQRAVIAGRTVGATTMTIYNADPEGVATTTETVAVSYIYDQRGQAVASVDLSGASAWFRDGRERLYCTGWTDGIVNDNGERIRGLGDAVLYLLQLAAGGGAYDLAEWRSVRSALNRIEIGGYVDSAVLPWTLITDELLPLFPRCSVLPGPKGLRPVLFDDADPESAPELIEGRDFYLPDSAKPEPATDGGVIAVRVDYAYSMIAESYLSSVVMGPRMGDQDESGHEAARAAWGWAQVHGTTSAETAIESAWLWRHDSAAVVADEVLRMGAERLQRVDGVLMDEERWRALPPGLSVRVTAATLGWDARPCWVCAGSLGASDGVGFLTRPRCR